MQAFQKMGFDLEQTADQSWTLRMQKSTDWNENEPRSGESMHHSGGAFSETCYIYGPQLEWGLLNHKNPKVLSIGLGLGYVEILTATVAIVTKNSQWRLDSFEIVEGLRSEFTKFCLEDKNSHPYQNILARMSQSFLVSQDLIYQELQSALKSDRLKLHGDLTKFDLQKNDYQLVCQDAFSRKTNPDLWSDEFLARLMNSCDENFCSVSSYASLGPLKRSLKSAGFNLYVRPGFHGKRNCTMATKGIPTSEEIILQFEKKSRTF